MHYKEITMPHIPSFITLPFTLERDAPPFEANAVKYPESLVRYFLKAYTKRGQKVFDPFTGLGTTLFVAEETGRIPFGLEYDERRYEWVAGQLEHWNNMACGDALKLSRIAAARRWPKLDFCMTSPPFMPKTDQWNPLSAGNPAKAGYDTYLRQMKQAFTQVSDLMKRSARIVVHVDDIPGRVFTPLARDISITLEKIPSLTLEADITIAWKNARKDYPCAHCLVFKKK